MSGSCVEENLQGALRKCDERAVECDKTNLVRQMTKWNETERVEVWESSE
jgi:hypothetical protein